MRDNPEIAPAPAAPGTASALRRSDMRKGVAFGLAAALIWGGYLAFSRLGVTQGLEPPDFAMLRFGVAGLVMLPYLARHGVLTLGGVGFWRGLILTACAGPVFMLIISGGYMFAPLAHGAVLPPASMTISTMILAAIVLGDRPSPGRVAGIVIIVAGLACVAGGGLVSGSSEKTWIGDILFASAGFLWAIFTVLQKRWGISPMQATAAMSVLSLVLLLPPFLVWSSFDRLVALPPAALASQIVIQGLLAGVAAVVAYAAAVVILGAGRAALFPPLVPATAILVGIPLTGEWPSALQWIGIVVVTAGLVAAMGVRLWPRDSAKAP